MPERSHRWCCVYSSGAVLCLAPTKHGTGLRRPCFQPTSIRVLYGTRWSLESWSPTLTEDPDHLTTPTLTKPVARTIKSKVAAREGMHFSQSKMHIYLFYISYWLSLIIPMDGELGKDLSRLDWLKFKKHWVMLSPYSEQTSWSVPWL